MPNVVVGSNSYASLAFADDYLSASIRAADSWSALDDDVKAQCLISFFRLLEKQQWNGVATGAIVASGMTIDAPGAGYIVGNELTVVSGTGLPAKALVVTIGSLGEVLSLLVEDLGAYSVAPDPSAQTTVDSGAGAGCLLTISTGTQFSKWPRTNVTYRDTRPVDPYVYPIELVQANVEGAYELSQDPSLETSRDANQNIRSVGAGPANVAFFRPQFGLGRFPMVVQELISQFMGAPVTTGPEVTGTCDRSQFTDTTQWTRSRGFP